MKWEQKTEMVKASNSGDFTKFKEVVLGNLSTFDGQAWDMFFNCVTLLKSEMVDHIEFYKTVHTARKLADEIIMTDSSLRCVMRVCLFDTILEESKEFNQIS